MCWFSSMKYGVLYEHISNTCADYSTALYDSPHFTYENLCTDVPTGNLVSSVINIWELTWFSDMKNDITYN